MHVFAELSILIAIAAGISAIMRLLKQPLIIGHILTGLIVGPLALGLIQSIEIFTLFGEMGIAILLFTVGLNLNPGVIKEFGMVSVITGLGQVTFTAIVGYLISAAVGFPPLTSLYLGIALSFSSTIIILKLITDKGDLESLYAKISIGFLLVQDLIAIMLLFAIPLLSAETSPSNIIFLLLRGLALLLAVYFGARLLMPKLNNFLSQSLELLFIFAIAWGTGVAALFQSVGFSIESGALIAGVALSTLPSRHEISARLMPLRDFFIVLFFILLGSQMQIANIGSNILIALILSVLVLVGNPLILMAIMGLSGYKKKTSLQTGFTVAQISEFSLILIALGLKFGHLEERVLSIATMVGIITIFGSTYMILYSDKIYNKLSPWLSIFERKNAREKQIEKKEYSAILFGCNRIGFDFLGAFKKINENFLVVDHNPEIIEQLNKMGVDAEYGDASDLDFLESLNLSKVQLAISTVSNLETDILIYRTLKAKNPDVTIITVAHRIKDALAQYGEGVDYVILPHFLGSKYAAELVLNFKGNKKKYNNIKQKHLEHLRLRLQIGHEHPDLQNIKY